MVHAAVDAMAGPKPTLLRRLGARVRSQLGLPFPWVREKLLGRDLVLVDGTLTSEPDYDEAWLHLCAQHAETMFDVGSNVGQSALIALLCPNVKQVVLIDANWEALSVAAQNLIRNNLSDRARFVCTFASDVNNEQVDFWTVGTGAAGSMFQSHAVTAARGGFVRRVSTMTVDHVAEMIGIVPDLVKIDVEGAEMKVLAGAVAIASRKRSRLLIEMHSLPELPMRENARRVLAWAEAAGYAVWYLREATRITTPDPIQHRGRCHLLLQPADWDYPPWLVGIKQSTPLPEG